MVFILTSALSVSAVGPTVSGYYDGDGNYRVSVDWGDGNSFYSDTSYPNMPVIRDSNPTVDADGNITIIFTVYDVTYTSTVSNGSNFSPTVVVDTTAPVITLVGDAVMNIARDSVFTDPGATAIDDVDGPVGVIASGSVDTTVVGTYIITYTSLVIAPVITPVITPVTTGSSGGTGFAPGYGPNLGVSPIVLSQVLGATTFRFTKVLRFGMTNNDVKELQELLRAEGFFTYKTSTGYFGSITKTALKAYQKSHKLIPYGVLNKATIAFING